MQKWKNAYEDWGFSELDHQWKGILLYVLASPFWIHLATWLLTRHNLIPGVDDFLSWLTLFVIAVPGNIRLVFLIALGPPRRRKWTTTWLNSRTNPLTQRHSDRRQVTRRQTPIKQQSPAGIIAKIFVGLTLLAVCGGYWLTGGTIVSPSDSTTEPPRLRNQPEKLRLLELINQARNGAGVPPVVMGTNNVAQIQADQLLEDCILSHWGTDGLKPYMRYSLAGGYQSNGENVLTFNECGLKDTWLHWNEEPMEMVRQAVEGWLESPGHRETMLGPEYRIVNIGLAWDRNVFKAIQHFEGRYVEYGALPVIEGGVLEVEGNLQKGYTFDGPIPLMAVIVYDPRPRRLTAGQLAKTYCYGHGEYTEGLIPPSPMLKDEFELTLTLQQPQCNDPYDAGKSTGEPESQKESLKVFEESREESLRLRETEITMTIRKAREMTAKGNEFSLRADVSQLLQEHGPGVYTVVLLASLEEGSGEPDTVISEYAIFHEIRPPTTYGRP